MRKLLLLIFCAVPVWGAIARTGSCGGTTSCTDSATATGDLKLVFAYRSGNVTPPTLPAGWTTITTIATTATGTVGSVRIGCNVSSSSGDTGSGTWTNSSELTLLSYSGTAVTSTASCNTGGIGNFVTNNAKASTTANFPVMPLGDLNNVSWIVGFAADSAAVVGDPTGLTQVTSAGTGPSVSAKDSNATATTWASANVTVTSSTWLTAVLEIRAPSAAVVSIVQRVKGSNSYNGQTISSYRMPLPNAGLSGNGYIVYFTYGSGVTVSSVLDKNDAGTTINTCTIAASGTVTMSANDTTDGQLAAVYACAGNASGGRNIVVTFSGLTSFIAGGVMEVRNMAAAQPFDGGIALPTSAGGAPGSSSTTPASGSFTPGVSGDFVCMFTFRQSVQTATSWTEGTNTNITWNREGFDAYDGFSAQCGTYSSASAINPTITMAPASTYITLAAAFKPVTQGTAATLTPRIFAVDHFNLPWSTSSGGNGTAAPASPALKVQITGSTGVLAWVSGGSYLVTAISDGTNTWNHTTCGTAGYITNDSNSGFWYANAATGLYTLSTTTSGNTSSTAATPPPFH